MIYDVSRKKGEEKWKEIGISNSDKISVIIPCYNVENYVHKCLDSVLHQTIGLSHIEVVAVDDASTDGTAKILDEYESKYPDQFCIIHCEENGKLGTARNIGMDYASGNHLMFLDADDAVAENILEELYKGIRLYGVDFAECTLTRVKDIPDKLVFDKQNENAKLYLIEQEEERKTFFVYYADSVAAVRRLYQTDFLKKNRIRFPEHVFFEDIDFTHLVLMTCHSLYHIDDPLYYYLYNETSVTNNDKMKAYYMDVHRVFERNMEELKRRNLANAYHEELEYVYYWKVFRLTYNYMVQHFDKIPKQESQVMKDYILKEFPNMKDNRYMNEDWRREYDELWQME